MSRHIKSVAVLGGGTMGTGIAGLCAQKDCKVLLLDVSMETAEKALDRIVNGRPPAVDDAAKAGNISLGTLDDDLDKIGEYDWVCEAIVEDLATKRALFEKLDDLRKLGSVVSTNTSGIPLRDITEGMPASLRRDVAVTHFFNPVKIMRLCELVPGADTTRDTIDTFQSFLGDVMEKGVVHAKDTVNFIGNRIGCFWILRGLHAAKEALDAGHTQEEIDAVVAAPFGLPPTGLYGLIDLIGLDIMDLVGKNLAINLPAGDMGVDFTAFPEAEHAMLGRGQFGRKTGGGFYKMTKLDDGSRSKETFDLTTGDWRPTTEADVDPAHAGPPAVFAPDALGRFCWDIMGGTLCYAADLVPEIADDIVNIDRAMRWGFAWRQGPFQLLDEIGPARVIEKRELENLHVPKMLQVLRDSGGEGFYRAGGTEYLGLDGAYHAIVGE